jgi:hypothetical protein
LRNRMNHERASAAKRQARRVSTMDSTTPSRPPAFTGQAGGGVSTAARRGLLQGVHRDPVRSRCRAERCLGAVLADGADFGFGTERGLGARFGCRRLARRGLSDRPGRMLADGADFGCGSGCGLGAELAAGVDIARNANSRCASGRGLGARMACGCVPRPGADFGRELRGRGAGPDATFEVPVGGTWEAHATSRR